MWVSHEGGKDEVWRKMGGTRFSLFFPPSCSMGEEVVRAAACWPSTSPPLDEEWSFDDILETLLWGRGLLEWFWLP